MRTGYLLLVLALATAGGGCQKAAVDPRTLPPLIYVVDVASSEATTQAFTGVVRARVESDLSFRVPGKIIQRLVSAGETVTRGEVLMRLDPTDLALQADAQGEAVETARARSVQADLDLARLHGLVERGAISAQTLDAARAAADSAHAQLAAARAQARVAGHARGYALLTADADGVVEDTSAEPGQVVLAGQTVLKLAHAGPREASVGLPESDRPAIGARAMAKIYGVEAPATPAVLRQLSQNADPATRTYDGRFVLEGAAAAAPLGATVTVLLPLPTSKGVETPLGALYDPGSGPGVWVLHGDRVAFVAVRVLSLGQESAEILGLPAGAQIVAVGANRLRQDEQLRIAPLPGWHSALGDAS